MLFLLPAPALERKISSKVFVLSYYQDVFCLAFCARYSLVLSAFLQGRERAVCA